VRIVITGATSGIGKEMSLQYAKPGVQLGLVGRRKERLAELAEACRERGAQATIYAVDVTDRAAMQVLAEEYLAVAKGVDLVIANAGVGSPDKLGDGDPGPMGFLMDVNVGGVINTVVPFVPAMKAQKSGHVVAIASIAGARALPHHAAYAASKACVRMLMDGWGYYLNHHGIKTTTINPGFIRSEMTDTNEFKMPFFLETDEACRRMIRAIAKAVPLLGADPPAPLRRGERPGLSAWP
jgi:NADP-dependent 3-hydroxy acid dehydrogenase YdfG